MHSKVLTFSTSIAMISASLYLENQPSLFDTSATGGGVSGADTKVHTSIFGSDVEKSGADTEVDTSTSGTDTDWAGPDTFVDDSFFLRFTIFFDALILLFLQFEAKIKTPSSSSAGRASNARRKKSNLSGLVERFSIQLTTDFCNVYN